MSGDILLDIPTRLLGVSPSARSALDERHRRSAPPKPRTGRSRVQSNTPFGVALRFLHISAERTGRSHTSSGVCRSRHNITVGDQPGNRVDHDDLPAHLPRITHGRRRFAALFSVIDGQQSRGVVYQKAVAVQHTIFVVGPTDADNRIRPVQDRIDLLRK